MSRERDRIKAAVEAIALDLLVNEGIEITDAQIEHALDRVGEIARIQGPPLRVVREES